MRTAEELYTYRFKQIDSMTTSDLALNYKLLNGNLTIINEANENVVASGRASL